MDTSYSLKNEAEVEKRLTMLNEKHVLPLTNYVKKLRTDKNLSQEIPYFDPLDGGVFAKYLFLLEAPGPNAVKSGFISRNNPDQTAKNVFEIFSEIGIDREKTIIWNIVPWYIGTGLKIRPANKSDINEGLHYLYDLLNLLQNVKAIALIGQKAQRINNDLSEKYKQIAIITTPHPSPLFINNKPENRALFKESIARIMSY